MKTITEYTVKDLSSLAATLNIAGRSAMKKAELYAEISERLDRCHDMALDMEAERNVSAWVQSQPAYPRVVGNNMVWACCESAIGPVCAHRTLAEAVEPALTIRDMVYYSGWSRVPRKLKKAYRKLGYKI